MELNQKASNSCVADVQCIQTLEHSTSDLFTVDSKEEADMIDHI